MDAPTLQTHDTFLIRQKVTAFVNRYVITVPATNGGEGELAAFVEQKRVALREEVTFYGDEAKAQALFRFKARQVFDVGATYDVTGADGAPIGLFRKDFANSLLRSTWHIEQPAADGTLSAVGRERSALVAVVRRA